MTKKYKVYLTEYAQENLEQIYSYIAADSVNEASNFILEIETKITTLESLPHRNPLIPENEFFG